MKHSMKNVPSSAKRPESTNWQESAKSRNWYTNVPQSLPAALPIIRKLAVSFDITGAKESEGTELFRSPNAVFYLSDPIRGMMGFARDGYLNTFPYKVNPGEKATIQIEGDNCSTTLRVNGKVVDEMNTQKLYFNAGKDSMNYVRTLVFPLEKAGNFNSKVQNLKVYNYCVSKP